MTLQSQCMLMIATKSVATCHLTMRRVRRSQTRIMTRMWTLCHLATWMELVRLSKTTTPPADGYEVLQCSGNVGGFECLGCKSFKGVGICSHVLTINHILRHFNVRYELKSIQTAASKKAAAKAGCPKPLPALERARVAEPDSSDEEEERLLALGQQGQ